MENAREEWDRAHSLGSTVNIPYNEYMHLLVLVGRCATSHDFQTDPKEWNEELAEFDRKIDAEYAKRAASFDELEDNDLICSLLEEDNIPIINENDLVPLSDEIDYTLEIT